MKPATRSRSGAAKAVNREEVKGRSLDVATGAGRIQQQQVAPKQVGPPRDQSGRFIRGGGSMEKASGSGLVAQQLTMAEQEVEPGLSERESSAGTEVSSFDNSSNDSDCDGVDGGKSVGAGDHNSGLSRPDRGLLADQVFDQLPQSGPAAHGVKMGAASTVRAHEGTVGVDQKAPWVNLFRDNRNLGKGITLEEMEVDGDLVMLEEDDVDVVEEAWGFCLVGLFVGRFPGLAAVNKLREGWKVPCTQWRHRSGWLVFKFQSDEDRLKVLNGGPYFAYGSNLMLKLLPSCFRFEGEDVSSVPIWIQLPDLPLDCWNARALSKIVSRVGKPITTAKMTLTKERLSFARVLVEVDVSSDIVSDVEIRLPTGVVYHQLVIAEYTPKFCKGCRTFGHVEGSCGKGSQVRQHSAYVAKKKSLSAGVSAPCAPVQKPIATPAMEVRVDKDAGQAGIAPAAPAVKPPGTVLEKSAPPVVEVLGVRGTGHPGMGSVPTVGVDMEFEEDVCSDEECSGLGQMGDGFQSENAALVADPMVTPMCPVEDQDADDEVWTRVGKKGKKKKKSGQPGAAVRQQSDGEGLLGGDPILDRAEVSLLTPYVPRWKGKGKGKGRQSFNGWRN